MRPRPVNMFLMIVVFMLEARGFGGVAAAGQEHTHAGTLFILFFITFLI